LQTFLPYEDFRSSAESLDTKRLGKQRVEAWQILIALQGGSGWRNHPAVKMWKGHVWWLLLYGLTICEVWRERGYRDSLLPKFLDAIESTAIDDYPPWLGVNKFHSSHRANLIRKSEVHYRAFGWSEHPAAGYYWPYQDNA